MRISFFYCFPLFLLSASGFLGLLIAPATADDSPRRVLVIYKANDLDQDTNGVPDSRDLALYYQAKRGVPASNLLGLTTTLSAYQNSSANLQLFYTEMVLPIRQ